MFNQFLYLVLMPNKQLLLLKPLVKEAQAQFGHIEKFSLNFSNSSFVIRVNLLHP